MKATPKDPAESELSRPAKLKNNLAKLTWRQILVRLVIIALVVLSGFLVYKYVHSQNEVKRLSNPQESAREETRQLTAKVGRLVEIPTNETPTIATVSDVSKLKDQPFYAKAQNGDKVLIFSQARRAFLYRPSTDKVIELAPINIGNNASANQQQTGQ
ncbi:hypothetical protein HYW35_03115 [Candidatus Saccharibacteria bacterium]|nr:hypothetical protein [Candidatus Saccharibacteria bacterium]